MKDLMKYVSTFIIAGGTVSGISYVGNLINPIAAGVISGIPISIPSTLLIKGKEKQNQFIWSAFLMVTLLAFITGLCAYLMIYIKMNTPLAVFISFFAWVIGAVIYYFYKVKK